jgi:hypothetical protein
MNKRIWILSIVLGVVVGLEDRSRNGKDEIDRTSWGWLAQET